MATDESVRNAVMQGFFGLQQTSGRGSTKFAEYQTRLNRLVSTLPGAGAGNDIGSGIGGPCDSMVDADGRPVWSQQVSGVPVCIGVDDPSKFNTYAPFAYDATFAVAEALHQLIEVEGADATDGDALMRALLNVRFTGVTGSVEFYHDPIGDPDLNYYGDRRVGVSYSVVNYQNGSLAAIGEWTPCSFVSTNVSTTYNCNFTERWQVRGVGPRRSPPCCQPCDA